MRLRLAFALFALCSSATAAACSGFSSEETQPTDAGVSVEDAPVEDAGPKPITWGTPKKLREASDGGTSIALRLGPFEGYYYAESALAFSVGPLSYAPSMDAAGEALVFAEAGLTGGFPTPVAFSETGTILYFHGALGTLNGIDVNGGSVNGPSSTINVADASSRAEADGGSRLYNAYMSPIAESLRTFCYVRLNRALIRGEVAFLNPTIFNESRVTVSGDGGDFTPEQIQTPVVSRDETTIYFSKLGDLNKSAMWMATRLPAPADAQLPTTAFGNARLVLPDETETNDFPTDLSADGKTLYFTRTANGASAVYSVTQNP